MPRNWKSRSVDRRHAASSPRKQRDNSDAQIQEKLKTFVDDFAAKQNFDALRQRCITEGKIQVSLKRVKKLFYALRDASLPSSGQSDSPSSQRSQSSKQHTVQPASAAAAGGRRGSADGFPSLSAAATAAAAKADDEAATRKSNETMAQHIATTTPKRGSSRKQLPSPSTNSDTVVDESIVEEAHHLVEEAAAELSAALPAMEAKERAVKQQQAPPKSARKRGAKKTSKSPAHSKHGRKGRSKGENRTQGKSGTSPSKPKDNAKAVGKEAARTAAVVGAAKANAKAVGKEAAKAAVITSVAKANAKVVGREAAKAAAVTSAAKANAKAVGRAAAKAAVVTTTAKSKAKVVGAEAAQAAAITSTAKAKAKVIGREAAQAAAVTSASKANAKSVGRQAAQAAAVANTAKANAKDVGRRAATVAAARSLTLDVPGLKRSPSKKLDPVDEAILRRNFQAFDIHKEGSLSKSEMNLFLSKLGWQDSVSVDEAFAYLETNVETGRITFDQFKRWHDFAWTHLIETGIEVGVDKAAPVPSPKSSQSRASFVSELPPVEEHDLGVGGPQLDAAKLRLDDVDIAIMRKHFDDVDTDSNGSLNSSEVRDFLNKLGWMDIPVEEAFEYLDIDSETERISFSEFLRWKEFSWAKRIEAGLEAAVDGAPAVKRSLPRRLSAQDIVSDLSPVAEENAEDHALSEVDIAVLKRSFAALDTDHDGSLSADEVGDLIKALKWGNIVSVDDVFSYLDIDSDDGLISFEEFLRWKEFAWKAVVEAPGRAKRHNDTNQFNDLSPVVESDRDDSPRPRKVASSSPPALASSSGASPSEGASPLLWMAGGVVIAGVIGAFFFNRSRRSME